MTCCHHDLERDDPYQFSWTDVAGHVLYSISPWQITG